ncbi:MAG: ABC transporter ATP-binding protein/permease [Clostridiales bacterium]|nr:ABC transporter ATP-binding protein/permease [Clostridiales bacterium]
MNKKDRDLRGIFSELINIGKLAKRYGSLIVMYTVLALVGTVFSLLTSLAYQSLIDFVIKSTNENSLLKFTTVSQVVAAAVSFTVFSIVFSALNSRISEKIRIKINTEMTADIFDSFICSQWEYTSLYSSGDILNRFNNDVGTVASSVIGILPNFIAKMFQFAGAFFVIFHYDRIMALIALVTIPLSLIFSRLLIKKMHTYAKEIKKINSKLMAFNSDALLNMQYLKSFGIVSIFCMNLRKLQREYVKLDLDYNKFTVLITSVMSFITQMVSYACFGWGVYRLWTGFISYGTLVLFIQLYSMLSSSFSSLINIVPTLINACAASERITEIKNLPKDDSLDDPKAVEFFDLYKNEPLSVDLNNISFRYMGDEEDALKDVSFHSETGDFTALTGPSGEGKTTLLRILLALVTPQDGVCKISSACSSEHVYLSPSTRRFFAYVPQKNTMFGDTLAANMRLVKPDATDEEICEALKIACAYDFVVKEKDGINCNIGDGGVGFSEGQMQRLSLARAVLRNAPINLFDEATSALDIDTEKQVLENLSEWGKNKICIFTTHRTSVFEVCNKAYAVTDCSCTPIM